MDRDLIHRYIDGELSPEERKRLHDEMDSDPGMWKELGELSYVVDMVEKSERFSVAPLFTSEVMKRLPVPKASLAKRISGFFFGQRVLRWNMAAALTVLFLTAIAVGAILQMQKKGEVVSYQPSVEKPVRTVVMRFQAPHARVVAVAGDFNHWSVEKGLMKKESEGVWTLEVPLEPGTYQYMFVVDGELWVPDPNAELYRDDGFGNKNSVLRVSL